MTTLVLAKHLEECAGTTTLVYVVEGEHQQTVIDFAVDNQTKRVHEKEYERIKKQCEFTPLHDVSELLAYYQGIVTGVVTITVMDCWNCDTCKPPFSFPMIIDFSFPDINSMRDKFFRLCDERQVDCMMMSEVTDLLDKRSGDIFGTSFFLLVDEDGEGGYTVKETRLGEHGAEFLRSCERV